MFQTVPDGYVKHNDLCFATLFKVENVLGLDTSTMSKYYEPSNAMQPIIFYECKKLSLEQVVALVLYSTMPLTARKGYADNLCKVSVPMDRVEELFFAYRAGDYFKLKLMLGKMFTRDGIDFSVVTYEFAKKVAPYTYRGALEQVKDGRVQMNRSGELTLLPIKHCHWCGLVRDDTLRLCDLCQEEQGYPVRTWFCGDKCEKRAMKLHGEEHARHHYLNLGFESKVRVLEPETEPLKGAEGKKKKKKKSGRAKK